MYTSHTLLIQPYIRVLLTHYHATTTPCHAQSHSLVSYSAIILNTKLIGRVVLECYNPQMGALRDSDTQNSVGVHT